MSSIPGGRGVREERDDTVHQTERRRLPKRRLRVALDESTSGVPLAERRGIGEWRPAADYCARRFDVGAGIEERVESFDVVAARRPVQRGLRVWASEPRVHVGTSVDQRVHDRCTVGKVPRPIGRHVQQVRVI